MATKKVKKFSRGGDILTGLGAGLAAFGAYKHFFGDKDKDKEQTSTGRDVSEPPPQDRGRKGEDLIRDAIEGKKGDKTDSGRNSSRSPVEEHAYITQGGSGGSDEASTTDSASVPKNGKKPKDNRKAGANNASSNASSNANKKDRTAEFANLYQGLTTKPPEPVAADTRLKSADVSGVGSNVLSNVAGRRREAAANEKAARDRLAKFEEKRREAKEREARRTQAQNKAKSGTSLKAPGSRFRAPGSKVDLNDPSSMILGGDLDPKRIVRESKSRMSGDVEYKKGGAVKKYASGGSVSSASKRADGIAMRGKTRGKVC